MLFRKNKSFYPKKDFFSNEYVRFLRNIEKTCMPNGRDIIIGFYSYEDFIAAS